MLSTSQKGKNMIRAFEGRSLRAYQDSVGVWTIGDGITNADKYAVAKIGPIRKGLTITPQQADELFDEALEKGYEPEVNRVLDEATQPTFDAGVSFHYNTGAIAKATWPQALKRGDMSLAKTSIMSWNRAGGSVLAGLTRRRAREWAMISEGDYGPEGNAQYVPTPIASDPKAGERVPGVAQLGDTGPKVAEVKGYLVILGRLPAAQANDVFDAATEAAVRAYQGAHPNLTVDGKIGPATTASLQRDIKLNGATKKTVGVSTLIASAGTALAAFGYATLKVALITAGVAGTAGLIFIVSNHWTELETLWNTLRKKQVP